MPPQEINLKQEEKLFFLKKGKQVRQKNILCNSQNMVQDTVANNAQQRRRQNREHKKEQPQRDIINILI